MFSHKFFSYFSLIVLLALVSCSSVKKSAKKLLEERNFREARVILKKALKKDRNQPDLLELKKQADNGLIQELLIALRNRNIEKKFDESIRIALEIREIRSEGDVEENVNGSQFEITEVRKTYQYFKNKTLEHVESNLPIKAETFLNRFSVLFESENKKGLKTLKSEINKTGKKKCQDLIKISKDSRIYFRRFTKAYCAHFNKIFSNKRLKVDRNLFSKLNMKFDFEKSSVSGRLESQIKSKTDKIFKKSVWYERRAKNKASLEMSGMFVVKQVESTGHRVHEYSVEIPYTAYETQTKTKSEPYTAYETVCKAIDSSHYCSSSSITDPKCRCSTQSKTKYRDVEYEEQVPVTRYRSESRTYDYVSAEIKFDGKIEVKGSIQFGKSQRLIAFHKQHSNGWYYSRVSRPDIQLYDRNPNPDYKNRWITAIIEQLEIEISDALDKAWETEFCQVNLTESNYLKLSDQVHTCAKLKKEKSEQLQMWIEFYSDVPIEVFTKLVSF